MDSHRESEKYVEERRKVFYVARRLGEEDN